MDVTPVPEAKWRHDHQDFERDWWGDCRNTFAEEAKQLTYAHKMGMNPINDGGRWPLYDFPHYRILDVGGGPTSMLLKCRGLTVGLVVDPCEYPAWTVARYLQAGIAVTHQPAEEFETSVIFDEAWCYNVLQHTMNPQAIIEMMRRSAKLVRIFEWVNFEPSPGHPHELKSDQLNEWLGDGEGWTATSEVYWDLNLKSRMWGGTAFHGYVETGL